MWYLKLVAPFDESDGALKCVGLQWATYGSGDEDDDVGETGNGKELVAAGEWFGEVSV